MKKLLSMLGRLVDAGNTVLLIEHNLDCLKSADHIIDLGPGAGEAGGRVVVSGTPERVAASKKVLPQDFSRRRLRNMGGNRDKLSLFLIFFKRPVSRIRSKTLLTARYSGLYSSQSVNGPD